MIISKSDNLYPATLPVLEEDDVEKVSDTLQYQDDPAEMDDAEDLIIPYRPDVVTTPSLWMNRSKRRRVRLLAFGALFLLVLPITIFGARDVGRDILRWLSHHSDRHPVKHGDDRVDTQNDCIAYAAWNVTENAQSHTQNRAYQATAVFELPISDKLYFRSRGVSSLVKGSIEFSDEGIAGSNVISVEITASYDRPKEFNLTQACWLQPQIGGRPHGTNGIGIIGPEDWYTRLDPLSPAPLSFDIKPSAFRHHVGDFHNSVTFSRFTLDNRGLMKGGYERDLGGAPITVDLFSGTWASFYTDDAEISGKFEVTRALHLYAGRSSVSADVTLVNSPDHPPTALWVDNAWREHNSNVTLISANKSGTGGAFAINVNGDSGPITVGIPYAPLDSVIRVDMTSKNAPVHATMPPEFEGTFLVTNNPSMPVLVNSTEADPARSRRERVFDVRRFSKTLEGSVSWQPRGVSHETLETPKGSVKIRGSGSTAVFVL
ncbi:hypothetical protein B0H21DRAFT_529561 [Amylocystis lapponica]|nr:hypothetical protein B0H21DRAFT_529561 [Amylocystis lapponica]